MDLNSGDIVRIIKIDTDSRRLSDDLLESQLFPVGKEGVVIAFAFGVMPVVYFGVDCKSLEAKDYMRHVDDPLSKCFSDEGLLEVVLSAKNRPRQYQQLKRIRYHQPTELNKYLWLQYWAKKNSIKCKNV